MICLSVPEVFLQSDRPSRESLLGINSPEQINNHANKPTVSTIGGSMPINALR